MDMARALATTRHRLAVRANVRNVVAGNGQTAVPGRERAGGVGVSCEAVHRETGIDASMRSYGIRFRAEPGEAVKDVVEPVEAQTAGERDGRRDVPVRLTEQS